MTVKNAKHRFTYEWRFQKLISFTNRMGEITDNLIIKIILDQLINYQYT